MKHTNTLKKSSSILVVMLAVVFLSGCTHNDTVSTPPVSNENLPQENGNRDVPSVSKDKGSPALEEGITTTSKPVSTPNPTPTLAPADKAPLLPELPKPVVRTFTVTGENFAFMVNGQKNGDIRVREGEKVIINFKSEDGFHDWKVDELSAATAKVQTGGTSSVEFTASKKGTFEYYCSVGSHRQMGMKGRLIVE